jgi:hypothetical protein
MILGMSVSTFTLAHDVASAVLALCVMAIRSFRFGMSTPPQRSV